MVIGGDNLPSPVRIGLTDLTNIGGPVAPLAPPVPASLEVVGGSIISRDRLKNFQSLGHTNLYPRST